MGCGCGSFRTPARHQMPKVTRATLTDRQGKSREVVIRERGQRVLVRWELHYRGCGRLSPSQQRPRPQCPCGAVDVDVTHIAPARELTPEEVDTINDHGAVL